MEEKKSEAWKMEYTTRKREREEEKETLEIKITKQIGMEIRSAESATTRRV
jgi:hypothetical protein